MVSLRGWVSDTFGWSRAAELGRIGSVHTATDGRDILFNSPDGWEVDKPWLWWAGPPGGDGTGGPFGNPPPGAGGPIYALTAIPAVSRCTSIIADTIAGLPWPIVVGDYTPGTPRAWLDDPQALRLDGRVVSAAVDDVRLSAVEFWSQWITAALWYGDGYTYVPIRGGNGEPVPPLYQLHPDKVLIDGGRYYPSGSDEPFAPGEIIHLRGEPPYFMGHGHGVLKRHAASLGLSLTIGNYEAGMYRSGIPSGYLKSEAPHMEQDDADELKAQWLRNHGGSSRSIAILNATTQFVPLSVSPVDAGLDVAKMWTLRDVAIAFGVPPYMLGVPGDSGTYANVESRMIELRQFTHLQWCRRIESTIDAQLPRNTSLKIKTAGLERADTMSRYQAHAIALSNGFMTVDEVRELEDLPPIDESARPPTAADIAALQAQMQGG